MTWRVENPDSSEAAFEALREAVGSSFKIRAPGFQGLQIFGGRSETVVASSGGLTYEFAMELPARDDMSVSGIAVILGQSRNSANNAAVIVDIKAIGALADIAAAWTSPTLGTFANGEANANQLVSAASAARRTHTFTDIMDTAPTPRTDGGTKPLAAARVFLGTANTMLLGISGDDFTNWSSRAAGLARFRVNGTAGDQRTTTTGWSDTSTGPAIGFAYSHLGPIYNGMCMEDSIGEGRGTYLNESIGLLACESINADNPKTWQSFSNLSWSTQNTTQILQNFRDVLDMGIIPDWIILPCASPNDITTTIADSNVDLWRANLGRMLALCTQYGICPIVRSMTPVRYDVKQFGSTDSRRIAWNAEVEALCADAGIPFFDLATVWAGAVEAHGQEEPNPTYVTDGIHGNSVGNAAGAVELKTLLQTVMRGRL
jgi:lysophospholipase L1-like esterase